MGLSQGQGSNLGWAGAAAAARAGAAAAAWVAGVPVMTPVATANPAAAVTTNIPALPGQPAAGTAEGLFRRLPPAPIMRAAPGSTAVISLRLKFAVIRSTDPAQQA
jgi:hypothetical protein